MARAQIISNPTSNEASSKTKHPLNTKANPKIKTKVSSQRSHKNCSKNYQNILNKNTKEGPNNPVQSAIQLSGFKRIKESFQVMLLKKLRGS